ncbi:phospholipase A [Motilimonas eburnea]|uniref:phospholipase A n=1 Tax=Motilimonas eburnea TaxID=1737488 RepID=UPI001E2F39E0|nr:phospholipase A [Motilimonas eburnea]MCE2572692.1 phospholipase A [Motilimonas eburnea]
MKPLLLTALILSSSQLMANETADVEPEPALEERLQDELETFENPFVITPHKPNYILLANYNSNLPEGIYDKYGDLQDTEIKFQLSLKIPVWVSESKSVPSVLVAYSQVSHWQAYNSDESSPFRETNYEPEVIFAWRPDYDLGAGWNIQWAQLGFNHQSNGRGGELSRSWNRIVAGVALEKDNLALAFVPWYRIQEDRENDDNHDITDYLGHGKIQAAYKWGDHTFALMSRNNLESGFSEGAVEGSWSFPLTKRVKGYVQFFTGYGSNLIEYNHYNTTAGIGIALTDWL